MDIELPNGVTYQTGWNLKLYPQNQQKYIDKALKVLGLSPSQLLSFKSKKLRFPSVVSVDGFLRNYIDLQSQIKKSQLASLIEQVTEPNHKNDLKEVFADKNKLLQWQTKRLAIIDVVCNMNINLSLQQLIDITERISVL